MKPLTKEQALAISEAHFKWYAEHPEATKEQLTQIFYKIRKQILSQSKNKN
jgi:hypothetical protein